MTHQFDFEIGNMADSYQKKSNHENPGEIRAVKNENRIRKISKMPKRTTYGGVKIDPIKLNEDEN